jgi:hypothetical protein
LPAASLNAFRYNYSGLEDCTIIGPAKKSRQRVNQISPDFMRLLGVCIFLEQSIRVRNLPTQSCLGKKPGEDAGYVKGL